MSTTPEPSETPITVPEHGIRWGVKQSFLRYLMGTGGTFTLTDGAVLDEGEFVFPLDDATGFDATTARGTLKCEGAVKFFGHFGALDLTLGQPWLEVDEEGASLSFGLGHPGRVAVVVLGSAQTSVVDGTIVWGDVPTRLLPHGDVAFNGVYGIGEQFDPLTIRIPEPTG